MLLRFLMQTQMMMVDTCLNLLAISHCFVFWRECVSPLKTSPWSLLFVENTIYLLHILLEQESEQAKEKHIYSVKNCISESGGLLLCKHLCLSAYPNRSIEVPLFALKKVLGFTSQSICLDLCSVLFKDVLNWVAVRKHLKMLLFLSSSK